MHDERLTSTPFGARPSWASSRSYGLAWPPTSWPDIDEMSDYLLSGECTLVSSVAWEHSLALAELVGGADALHALHAEPHTAADADEPAWAAARDDERALAAALVADIERTVPLTLFDEEYRVIARRVVQRLARAKPGVLRRGEQFRTAAAVVWLVLQGNGMMGRNKPVKGDAVGKAFGLGSPSYRAHTLFHALELPRVSDRNFLRPEWPWLTDPALLHSSVRAELVAHRERTRQAADVERRFHQAAPALQVAANGQLQVKAEPVAPLWVLSGETSVGRRYLTIGLGHDGDERAVALTEPDARLLAERLLDVLEPPPVWSGR